MEDFEWLSRHQAHITAGVKEYEDIRLKLDAQDVQDKCFGLIRQGLQTAKNADPDALGWLDADFWAGRILASWKE